MLSILILLAASVMSYLLLLYIVWLLKSHSVSCLGSEDARQVNEMFAPLTTVWLLGPSMIVEGSTERDNYIYNSPLMTHILHLQ